MKLVIPSEIPFTIDELKNIPKNPLIVCCGTRCTGKTKFNIFMSSILCERERFKKVIVLSPRTDMSQIYRENLMNQGHKDIEIISEYLSEDIAQRIITNRENNQRNDNTLIIIDDALPSRLSSSERHPICHLFHVREKLNLTFIVCMQYPVKISPCVSPKIDILVMFNSDCRNKSYTKRFYDLFLNRSVNRSIFNSHLSRSHNISTLPLANSVLPVSCYQGFESIIQKRVADFSAFMYLTARGKFMISSGDERNILACL